MNVLSLQRHKLQWRQRLWQLNQTRSIVLLTGDWDSSSHKRTFVKLTFHLGCIVHSLKPECLRANKTNTWAQLETLDRLLTNEKLSESCTYKRITEMRYTKHSTGVVRDQFQITAVPQWSVQNWPVCQRLCRRQVAAIVFFFFYEWSAITRCAGRREEQRISFKYFCFSKS